MTPKNMRKFTVNLFGTALVIMLICAVAAIFVDGQAMGQLVGTGAITLLASTVLYGGLRQFERSSSRWGGLVTLILAMLAWIFVLLAIWAEEEELVISAFATAACWLPLFTGGCCLESERADTTGRFLLASFIVIYLGWLLALWGNFDEDNSFFVLAPSALGSSIVGMLLLRSLVPKWIRMAAIAMVTCGTAYWIVMSLNGMRWSENLVPTLIVDITITLPACCAFTHALLLTSPKRAQWLRPAIAVVGATCLLCIGLTIAEEEVDWPTGNLEELFTRLAFASGLSTLAGTLTLIVLTRLNRSFVEFVHDTQLELVCPRCRRMIEIGQGDSLCPNCSLNFRIHCEAPDCRTCGYTLSPTFPERCPECGTQVLLKNGADPGLA